MTERNTVKMKRSEDLKSARKPSADSDIRAENNRLRADLAAAQQRIAELEQRTSDALNRIEWAIDSLHNLSEDG
jgi:phosphoenolpyruvate-protein kinase (PTS system EI component)